jgi:hypothetical protein
MRVIIIFSQFQILIDILPQELRLVWTKFWVFPMKLTLTLHVIGFVGESCYYILEVESSWVAHNHL